MMRRVSEGVRGLLGSRAAEPPAAPAPAPSARGPQGPAAARPRAAVLAPSEVFTPSQPKAGRRQLTGRRAELDRIMQALREDKSHVVLYSERGRGKTSLANNVVQLLRQQGVIVARHTCEAESTFDSIMRGLLRDLPPALLTTPLNPAPCQGCEAALPPGELRPPDMVSVLSRLSCRELVCVIDEFDRIGEPATLTRVADTVKQLSDRAVPLSLMIVGVSENLEQILGRHPSIQRNLVAVQLPLLTDAEIGAIIERGGQQSGFVFPLPVVGRITALARGNPYMAQLLGLRLAQAASARGDTTVSEADFAAAVARIVDESPPYDVMQYAGLTANGRDREMVTALRRLAAGDLNVWGRIETTPEPDGGVSVNGRRIAPAIWARVQDADILRAIAPGSGLYVFRNRSLMHHVLLQAARTLASPGHAEPAHDERATEPAADTARVHLLASRA